MLDLTHLIWHRGFGSGASRGSLYKAVDTSVSPAVYYKLSAMLQGRVVGHEAANEVVASRLLDVLGIPHVQYSLVHASVIVNNIVTSVYACSSLDYRKGAYAESLERVMRNGGAQCTPLQFMQQSGFQSYLDRLFIADFLVVNRDRHGDNVELLRYPNGVVAPAPLFDFGNSFIAPLRNNLALIRAYEPLCDEPANNFIGSISLFDNLHLISRPVSVKPLRAKAKSYIFAYLKRVLTPEHIAKIWSIILYRYSYLKDNGFIIEQG